MQVNSGCYNKGISEKSNRNNLIDIEKMLAIFLVVWGHLIAPDDGALSLFINMCHMPVFFAVSGFFFYDELKKYSFTKFLSKKTLRLFVPFLIWSSISLFFNIIFSRNFSGQNILNEFLEVFIYARSVWFFIALFILLVSMRCACEVSRLVKIPNEIFMFLFFIMFFFIKYDSFFALYKLKEFSLFFILGYEVKRLKDNNAFKISSYKFLALILPLYVLYGGFVFDFRLPQGQFPRLHSAENFFWILGCGIGLLFLIGFSDVLNYFKFTKKISCFGTYSMDIYVMHMFFIKVLKLFLPLKNPLSKNLAENLLRGGVYFLLSMIICFMIILLARWLRKLKVYRFSIGM